ncbi:MAG: RNA polymerase sigma factor [Rhodospirillales bacterium]|nr:RNA polymerase sigma factor [Rhodospirillales bacterium]
MAKDSDSLSPQALMIAAIPRLRRFATSITGNVHLAEDLSQTALERALANISRWQPGTSMESWLLRIAYNAWIDDVRSKKRRGQHVNLDAVGDLRGEDGRVVSDNRLDLEAARAAMAELPLEFRSVLSLVALDGMSYQEVADTLKIPIGTVMSRLSRARKSLLEALDRAGESRNG